MTLNDRIQDEVNIGAIYASPMLGFIRMPEGYALMLNSDQTHFYWINDKGEESVIHWDKWAVYRGAKAHKSGKT